MISPQTFNTNLKSFPVDEILKKKLSVFCWKKYFDLQIRIWFDPFFYVTWSAMSNTKLNSALITHNITIWNCYLDWKEIYWRSKLKMHFLSDLLLLIPLYLPYSKLYLKSLDAVNRSKVQLHKIVAWAPN